jgi:hypothetical protein
MNEPSSQKESAGLWPALGSFTSLLSVLTLGE